MLAPNETGTFSGHCRLAIQPHIVTDEPMSKLSKMQHEITEELEGRSGVKGLKLIRLKGYTAELGPWRHSRDGFG